MKTLKESILSKQAGKELTGQFDISPLGWPDWINSRLQKALVDTTHFNKLINELNWELEELRYDSPEEIEDVLHRARQVRGFLECFDRLAKQSSQFRSVFSAGPKECLYDLQINVAATEFRVALTLFILEQNIRELLVKQISKHSHFRDGLGQNWRIESPATTINPVRIECVLIS